VLKHFAESGAEKAVVVTDGYIEPCSRRLLRRIAPNSFHAVVSRDGSTALLDDAGIPCHQLEQMPA